MAKRVRTRKYNIGNATLEVSRYAVDVVIPVYNRFDLLKRCLDALESAFTDESGMSNFRVWLIDNGSTDPDANKFYMGISKDYPKFPVSVYKMGRNTGFPHACNNGARRGTAPVIFFLNSDVILDPGSAIHMVKYMSLDTKAGICGMKLVFPSDSSDVGLREEIRPAGKIQHVGLFTNIRAEFHHIFVGWSEHNPRPNSITTAHAVTGAALMIYRKLYNEIGGFFEGYGLGTYEDVELCMETHRLGYNILVDTQARGVHYTGATSETYRLQYPLNENRALFLSRWGTSLIHSDWRVW